MSVSSSQPRLVELDIPADQAPADLRIWSDFCHVLLNVKEFVYLQ